MVERCIPITRRRDWEAALSAVPHAFAHTWGSCHATGLATGHQTFLYVVDTPTARIVCPLAEREYRGFKDIYTPYGFSGFLAAGSEPDFRSIWRQFVTRHGYVSGYFGLNPILDTGHLTDPLNVATDRCVYVLDLTLPTGQLFANLHTNRRRQLKEFDRLTSSLVHDSDRLQEFFGRVAPEFYRRRSAQAGVPLHQDLISGLFELDSVFAVGASEGRALQAVAVFGWTPWVGEYLFNVSIEGGERHSTILLWSGIRRLQELGVASLNLGGGVRQGDGVARFKERFGAMPLPHRCAREVYRPEVYRRLCQNAGVDERADYFPPYHASRRPGEGEASVVSGLEVP